MKKLAMNTLAILGLAFAMAGPACAAVSVGDTPPDSLGRSHDGEVRISEQRGKVVVVTFWASWCGYCRQELPVLAGMQKAAGKDRIEVVAVNHGDDRDVYRALLRKLKDVQLTMTHDASGDIGKAFGVQEIPRLFVIDQAGKVAYVHTGYSDDSLDQILDAINKLLVHPAMVPAAT